MKIIGSRTCPFVQRAVIIARLKNLPLEMTYIDLTDKPDWFLDLSPFGRVPLLDTEQGPLFESLAICEYLNEATATPNLLPPKGHERAVHRAWMLVTDSTYSQAYSLAYGTKDAAAFAEKTQDLARTMAPVLTAYKGPFFAGAAPMMVDAFWYPVMRRTTMIGKMVGKPLLEDRFVAWYRALHEIDAFATSLPHDYEQVSLDTMRRHGSHAASCAVCCN
ncbi:MAG: glutathione S-transferase family protein [Pseudomonadota bacterium]